MYLMQITRQIVSANDSLYANFMYEKEKIAIASQKSTPRNSICRFDCQFIEDSSILVHCSAFRHSVVFVILVFSLFALFIYALGKFRHFLLIFSSSILIIILENTHSLR